MKFQQRRNNNNKPETNITCLVIKQEREKNIFPYRYFDNCRVPITQVCTLTTKIEEYQQCGDGNGISEEWS